MDNQHKKIKGYRDLSQVEIDLINRCKELEAECLNLIGELELSEFALNGDMVPNGRWLETGKTDLQKGFMSIIRSIAKPR